MPYLESSMARNWNMRLILVLLIMSMAHDMMVLGQLVAPQAKEFVLSDNALAAAARFREQQKGRKIADLELILGEFYEWDQSKSSFKRVAEREITKRRLLELLGPPDDENEQGEVLYHHEYGYTRLFFEAGYFKERSTLIEWVAEPQPPYYKRLWYKIWGWSKRLGRLL